MLVHRLTETDARSQFQFSQNIKNDVKSSQGPIQKPAIHTKLVI